MRCKDQRALEAAKDKPMEVIAQGICLCGGTYIVTRTQGEDRDRVRHSNEPKCEYFENLGAPDYLQGIAQWKARVEREAKEGKTPKKSIIHLPDDDEPEAG